MRESSFPGTIITEGDGRNELSFAFGVTDSPTESLETLRPELGEFPWGTFPRVLGSGVEISGQSDSASDVGVDVSVVGLDINGGVQIQPLVIQGTSLQTMTGFAWYRSRYAFIATRDNGPDLPNTTPTGTITLFADGVEFLRIRPGMGESESLTYTVPADVGGFLVRLSASCERAKDSSVLFFLREYDEVDSGSRRTWIASIPLLPVDGNDGVSIQGQAVTSGFPIGALVDIEARVQKIGGGGSGITVGRAQFVERAPS